MMKQLCLKTRIGEPPILTLRDAQSPEKMPDDVVELPGAVIEATSRFDKDSSVRACAKIAELCRAGDLAQAVESRVRSRIEVSKRLLSDLYSYVDGTSQISSDSAETLIARVIAEIDKMVPPLPKPEYKPDPSCEGAQSTSV